MLECPLAATRNVPGTAYQKENMMPKILLLAVLAATLSTVGCLESEDETLTSSTEDSLLGTWRLDLGGGRYRGI